MASCICIRDPRRGRHWRSPQSARPCCRRFVEVDAARVAGGLSTSQSCTLAKMSSFLTSRAGGRADCHSIRMRPSSRWLPIGCAKCFRLQRAELIQASSEPSTRARALAFCGSSTRSRGHWKHSNCSTASGCCSICSLAMRAFLCRPSTPSASIFLTSGHEATISAKTASGAHSARRTQASQSPEPRLSTR